MLTSNASYFFIVFERRQVVTRSIACRLCDAVGQVRHSLHSVLVAVEFFTLPGAILRVDVQRLLEVLVGLVMVT